MAIAEETVGLMVQPCVGGQRSRLLVILTRVEVIALLNGGPVRQQETGDRIVSTLRKS